MTSKAVITDRKVQLACDRASEAGDEQLVELLQQLLEFREHGRVAVAEHDLRVYYNRGVSWMTMHVKQSGCEWRDCEQRAETVRVQRSSGQVCWLCYAHADEGEVRGNWNDTHPDNACWKEEDAEWRK
jgi:hypothetical protein